MNLSEGYNKRLKELSGIIQEDRKRVEFLRGKFLSKYTPNQRQQAEKIFTQIIAADPSKNKQYSNWLLNLFFAGTLKLEDLYKATEYLYFYDELKRKNLIPQDKKDIGKFTTLQQLHSIISELGGTGEIKEDEKYLIEDRFFINNGQAELIFENGKWLVVVPRTFAASQFYGCSSQWCTKFPEQFENYSKDGPLLVIIDKTKLNEQTNARRYQFHFPSHQFMDFSDQSINLSEFLVSNRDLAAGLSKFLVEAVNAGYEVLNAEEIAKLPDARGNYIQFEMLPPEAQKPIIQRIVDGGLVVSQGWLDFIDEKDMPVYIDNRLRRSGVTGFENIWNVADNRQKVYYIKKAAAHGDIIPDSILNSADNRMIQFYLGEISKKGKTLPDSIYNLFSPENRVEYLKSMRKVSIFDLNQLTSNQVSGFDEPTVQKIIDRIIPKTGIGLSKFPLLLTNAFFNGLSDNSKNYYIGKIFQAVRGDASALSGVLTKHQLSWGQTYGFL